ncbi:hypothetical protein B0H11DRAFT_2279268 [Mycena galericulata]|nr:hypothetical protein B0H11DRAFT_2279268 [Mycena galericulata]
MSVTVEELEARIAKISVEIELQKTVLKSLEHSKILVQHQLNSIRDPVTRLPLEISSEIFIHCLPPLPEPGAHRFPMLLLNVCYSWTCIALSTPTLWNTIRIVSPRTEGFRKLVRIWLQRARNRPLSISLYKNFDASIAPIFWRYGQQVKHLEVCNEQDDDEEIDEDEDEYIGVLGPGPLPLLETLTLHWPSDSKPVHRGSQILQLLRLAPNLADDDIEVPLVLPKLSQFIFDDEDDEDSEDGILRCLTLPRLKTLSLSMYVLHNDDHLLAFLKRSSPLLRGLVLGAGCDYDDLPRLVQCLRLVPTLTRFELKWLQDTALEPLFAALAQSPTHVMPNLCTLVIRLSSPAADCSWEPLLRALTARRTQIQSIHVEFDSTSTKPAANILAGFAELVADGMEVYIGTMDENFCSG